MQLPPTLLNPDDGALSILHTLQTRGYEALFCGGCVRDALLGNEPQDWDIATSATPDEIETLFPHTVPVGKSFGVMLVVCDGTEYEVATFRSDSASGDGRRPDTVQFVSAEEDVSRRDFTVNGLLFDPERQKILDYVGGIADLEAKIIRCIDDPKKRFCEDHLRILRAIRFAANLDFAIQDATYTAIRENSSLVKTVAAERIGEELVKLLTRGNAGNGFRLMESSGLLQHILPEIVPLRSTPQPPEFHPEGDVMTHTLMMLDSLPDICPETLAWAALLHDIGKPATMTEDDRIRFNNHHEVGADMAVRILERLKRPRRTIDAVEDLIRSHMRFTALPEMRTAKRRRWLRDPLFPQHLELHRLDCLASHAKLEIYEYAKAEREREEEEPAYLPPLLRGSDLIEMGLTPGPVFSKILTAVEDARLEGRISNREEAVSLVQSELLS